MTDAIVPYEQIRLVSKELAPSGMIPTALGKKPENVLAVVLAGAELGLAPMASIRGLTLINGKVGMASDLMAAIVLKSGAAEYFRCTETTDKKATFTTKRKGQPEQALSFTIEQAEKAFLKGDNWKKYPEAMLRARAQSALARLVFPDVLFGVYDSTSGELDEVEKDVTPIASHVEEVKEQLRADLEKPKAPVIEDAEIIKPPETFEDCIAIAESLEALAALMPKVKGLSKERIAIVKPIFLKRKAELESKS